MRAEAPQPRIQDLRRPAELLVCGVAETEDSERELVEEVVGEVGAKEEVKEGGRGARFTTRAGGGDDEDD